MLVANCDEHYKYIMLAVNKDNRQVQLGNVKLFGQRIP